MILMLLACGGEGTAPSTPTGETGATGCAAGGTVTGTVTHLGDPLEGAQVTASAPGRADVMATTDAAGAYSLELAAGPAWMLSASFYDAGTDTGTYYWLDDVSCYTYDVPVCAPVVDLALACTYLD